MGKLVSAVLGGGDAPKVGTASLSEAEEAKRKAKKSRAALFETEGGSSGEELNPNQVTKRGTLLGN